MSRVGDWYERTVTYKNWRKSLFIENILKVTCPCGEVICCTRFREPGRVNRVLKNHGLKGLGNQSCLIRSICECYGMKSSRLLGLLLPLILRACTRIGPRYWIHLMLGPRSLLFEVVRGRWRLDPLCWRSQRRWNNPHFPWGKFHHIRIKTFTACTLKLSSIITPPCRRSPYCLRSSCCR